VCRLECSGLPTVTRLGDVKDIFIRETLDPLERDAGVGDEVRWINKRNGAVRTCSFSRWMNS
jgi:hypothetical protein